MRPLLLVLVASLVGACVVEEPVDELANVIESEQEAPADPETVRPPPRTDCQANLNGCLASPLGGAPGGQPGHSRCVDCYDLCRGSGSWPNQTNYGGDCTWWNY
jgi:hypothetical protein